jgi:hypothetical protein
MDQVSRRLSLLLTAALLATLASLAPVAPAVPGCAAAGSSHAALLVEHADGSVVTRCVAFDTAAITGEELLNRSGLTWSSQTFGSFGDAVCALDMEPAQYAECPGKDRYWAVFVARAGGSWQLANAGISTMTLSDGDAEGFRYVPASGVPAAPASAAGACAAAASTPAPVATSTLATAATPTVGATGAAPLAGHTATAPPAGRTSSVATPSLQAAEATPAPTASAASVALVETASLVATASATPLRSPVPTPSRGVDLGLLAAALAGGGLAGLALLRLLAARRGAP